MGFGLGTVLTSLGGSANCVMVGVGVVTVVVVTVAGVDGGTRGVAPGIGVVDLSFSLGSLGGTGGVGGGTCPLPLSTLPILSTDLISAKLSRLSSGKPL